MLLTIRAMTIDQQVNESISKPTTPHHVLATRLGFTLAFDIIQKRHFVSNVNKTFKYVTTSSEGESVYINGALHAVSGDGLTAAILKTTPVTTPLYTNPLFIEKLKQLRAEVNKPVCTIYEYNNSGEAFTKRRTIKMKSTKYKKIILTDDGGYLLALPDPQLKKDLSIEIYKKQANTYKLIQTNISNQRIQAIATRLKYQSERPDVEIDDIGLMDGYIGIILKYGPIVKTDSKQFSWQTKSMISINLADLLSGEVHYSFFEPVNYRVTSGNGYTDYQFVGDAALCFITDFDGKYPTSDVYVFDKNLSIIHSVSLNYLHTQPSKTVVLDIPPYTPDRISHPITLTT